MLWLRISIMSLFLILVLYFQFFFDFRSIMDETPDELNNNESARPEATSEDEKAPR